MSIRQMTEDDLEAVVRIEQKCFTDAWSIQSFQESLKEAAAHLLVVTSADDAEVIGYGCLYHAVDEGEIVNVAIAPEHRMKGLGAELVRGLMHLGGTLGETRFFLEVRSGNTAGKRLYESLGFEVCGLRKGFYSNPKEDAVLMMWQQMDVCQ